MGTPLFNNDSDSASDIQQKTDKAAAAQQVLPQRKNSTSRANKIFDTSSSIEVNDKISVPSPNIPDNFIIPNTLSQEKVAPQRPLPDTELYTDDEDEMEIFNKPMSDELFQPGKESASDTVIGFSDEIAESRHDVENEDDEEIIPVLDSDEESEEFIKVAPPNQTKNYFNCSLSETSSQKLDNFFNNPPSVIDQRLVVRLSDIQRAKIERQAPHQICNPIIEENEDVHSESDDQHQQEEERVSQLENIEIGPTDEEDNLIDLTIEESPPQQRVSPVRPQRLSEVVLSTNTPRGVSAQISTTTPRSGKKNITNINIKFDLKISIRDGGSDSDTSNNSDNLSSQKLTESQSPTQNSHSKNRDVRMEKFTGGQQMTPVKVTEDDEPKTPKMIEPIIDEGLEDLLNEIYGDTWKTPQLLKSCKSKRGRENLRKSIHANNFDSFVRNLPSDLESTRITPSVREDSTKKEKFKMPIAPPVSTNKASNKKNTVRSDSELTPRASPSAHKETPRYVEICDPDTSSSSSSDEINSDDEFNPNDDSWNASSDEEYKNENERIQKRKTIRQSLLHHNHEELTFTRDESIEEQEKLEELLKKYEFKAPQTDEIGKVKKVTKRKLFTHTYYDEEDEEGALDEKENEIPKGFKEPTPVQIAPSLTKIKPTTPKSSAKRFGPLSFLQSLDAEANRSLCNADALFFRNNYKSKKHDLADKLFKLYNEKVFDLKLTNVPVKWNKKLLNTAGRCHNSRTNGVMQSSLELSDKVLTSADRLRCTLIHEMCHAATWVCNGENGHGAVWKRWAAKANSTFPELPKITVCHNYVIEYKYTYLCINCKAQSKTHSKSRKVDEIQCSICKGKIKLFENKKNALGKIEMVPVQKKELKGIDYIQTLI